MARLRDACGCLTMVMVLAMVEHGSAQSQGLQSSPPHQSIPALGAPAVIQEEEPQFQRTTPGPRRPRAATRSSRGQSFTLTANVLGGYDDNAGATQGSVPVAPTSGSSAFADAMLEYSRGSATRRITLRSLGSLQMYPDYLAEPAFAGKARVSGYTALGPRNMLRFSAQGRYEPLFTPGVVEEELQDATTGRDIAAMSPPLSGGGVPATGLFERRSFVSSNKAYLERKWSPRDQTVVSYLYYAQRIIDGGAGDNRYQQAAVDYSRKITRATALHASYQYTGGRMTDASDRVRPNKEQTLSGGPEFAKSLAGRPLSVRLSAGATYLEQVHSVTGQPIQGWTPDASAAAAVDLTRTWSLNAGYSRGFTMLQGLTGEFYSTDRVSVSTATWLTSRAYFSVGGTFATGQTLVASGVTETFSLSGATLQVRVALTSKMGVTAGYFLNSQRYSNPAALPTGFPQHYDRKSFLVGLTFWTRLAGTLPVRPRAAGEW